LAIERLDDSQWQLVYVKGKAGVDPSAQMIGGTFFSGPFMGYEIECNSGGQPVGSCAATITRPAKIFHRNRGLGKLLLGEALPLLHLGSRSLL
jgi:hypothetical protein